jgi:hypothetical protein
MRKAHGQKSTDRGYPLLLLDFSTDSMARHFHSESLALCFSAPSPFFTHKFRGGAHLYYEALSGGALCLVRIP